jgi:hypothetical protein
VYVIKNTKIKVGKFQLALYLICVNACACVCAWGEASLNPSRRMHCRREKEGADVMKLEEVAGQMRARPTRLLTAIL